jgi:dipeptidyl-peptidase-4
VTTSFPRQHARTRRFSLGVPRGFVSGEGPDGPTVLFLRTDTGEDPVTHLWRHDVATGRTTKLLDAGDLDVDERDLPAEERARRERAREQAGGVVAFAADTALTTVALAIGGRLVTVEVATGRWQLQPSAGPAFDPRPSPDGSAVAYHAADGLHLLSLPGGPAAPGETRPLVIPSTVVPGVEDSEAVSWGRAEFVAAEEMGRSRGYWWSGDGRRLAVTRVDEQHVAAWTIADPAAPERAATLHRYPAAGTTNAAVGLWLVDATPSAASPGGGGRPVAVRLPGPGDAEYLAAVSWGEGPLTVTTQSRDQRRLEVRTVAGDGTTTLVRTVHDDAWVELVPGTPAWSGDALVTVEDRSERGTGGTRSLCVDGVPVTPPGLQVREVTHVDDELAAVLASDADPTEVHAHRVRLGGAEGPTTWCVTDAEPGVHREVAGRARTHPWVRVSHALERTAPRVVVHHLGDGGERTEQDLEVVAARPVIEARPRLLELGPRRLRAALLLPRDDDGSSPLPVLLDPYGGPHAQRVLQAGTAHLTSQWFADLGLAVLVVDGRGSPGRGPVWERAVHGDLAGPVLSDQLDALDAAARAEPRLDLDRVAIRGWSFGGYLAALAALRRPDRFRAAIAGAPVTDWTRYDTHYTERYLGHPDEAPDAYRRSNLVDADGTLLDAQPWDDDAPELLLIHGLADDNVVAAHSLQLSSALLADGRQHGFLPLSGVTHMTPQEVVAERLLTWQADLLRRSLGLQTPAAG